MPGAASSGTDFMAGATRLQGQADISWLARYKFRGRHSTLARSGADFVAVAALSQISWQVQDFRQVRYTFRGRRQGRVQNS